MFIAIEGGDRVGKSTQINLLKAYFTLKGKETVVFKFPNRSTKIGKLIDECLHSTESQYNDQSIHLLFSANRWEEQENINKALNEDKIVICDRYTHSGIAYSHAKGLPIDWCCQSDNGILMPDLIIYLSMSAEAAASRSGYGEELYERKEFQIKVGAAFEKLKQPDWLQVNAENSVDNVHSDIVNALNL